MNEPEKKWLFELQSITKSFGPLRVLDRISLSIELGKTTVIIGPSGCGKTVLLKHLILLVRPDRGRLIFDGMRIDRLPESKLIPVRRRCGFLFQAGALFDSQTVAQNVAFPLLQHTKLPQRTIDQLVEEKLQLVGMGHLGARLPAELSGGQQRRVALARAIALAPEVILYDEPTTGLDPIRADTINELIIKLQRDLQITSVVVTHDMNSAYKIGDRIVMLDKGRILTDGTPEQIQQSDNPHVQQFIQGRSEGFNGNHLDEEDKS
jgi:phospholipid/cholesterol/gamma-HCH transport system ATP-binding protein